ncbi:MAG: NAD-dependent epimerase/dehydratase family protein [Thiomargarita sp.]|nr:NAD-dependent epimerase/dehydratase family protein [Thiomargarita sp.]
MSIDSISKIAIVTGATSQIGHFLLPYLQAANFTVIAISRNPPALPKTSQQIIWQLADLTTEHFFHAVKQPITLFHIAPLPLLPALLNYLVNNKTIVKRVIAFSSTSALTKLDSPDSKEKAIAFQLFEAEKAVAENCINLNINWTIFRPTLIYGCGLDKNISFIAKFIHRFGFFPILEQGNGLRQPVHAADLAQACLQANQSPEAVNKIYQLTGGETLNYYEMVLAIFKCLGKKPRIIPIPLKLFQLAIHCINWLPAYKHLSPNMINRMDQDLCFEHQEASQDFGYYPRKFTDMGFN